MDVFEEWWNLSFPAEKDANRKEQWKKKFEKCGLDVINFMDIQRLKEFSYVIKMYIDRRFNDICEMAEEEM